MSGEILEQSAMSWEVIGYERIGDAKLNATLTKDYSLD